MGHIFYLKFPILILLLLSCQNEDELALVKSKCLRTPKKIAKLIVGNNDWIQFNHSGNNPQNSNEQTVAQIHIPTISAACTGFLINEDTIMTNNHCISSASWATNVTATFRNVDESKTTFVCNQFITTSIQYDFTLIKCQDNPGSKFGWVGLSKKKPEKYFPLYMVQENCDYVNDPHCMLDKFVSFGYVLDLQSNRIYYDVDSLSGSSGSPIFSSETHQVIAIHNAASPATATSADMNAGVLMNLIRNIIESTTNVVIHEWGTAGVFSNLSPDLSPELTANDNCKI